MPLKNNWKHDDIVQPEDMNDIANEVNMLDEKKAEIR